MRFLLIKCKNGRLQNSANLGLSVCFLMFLSLRVEMKSEVLRTSPKERPLRKEPTVPSLRNYPPTWRTSFAIRRKRLIARAVANTHRPARTAERRPRGACPCRGGGGWLFVGFIRVSGLRGNGFGQFPCLLRDWACSKVVGAPPTPWPSVRPRLNSA